MSNLSNLIPYIVIWAVLATVMVIMYVYRRSVAQQEDPTLHVLDADASHIPQQALVAKKLEAIDRWGKWLTVIVILYSVALAGLVLYHLWLASARAEL